ncbi:hypothetical protein BJ138DRAFT_131862 [Hygrophoropsis aurantiaca]|uniref:Uncharacterized protein n=1 Tax=Hygrophoropsis aurantiaca TaxID=72124 RepID=A0ACB8AAU8_9AGAM|nr:hypothetical protein BJ138DRAFT_131862 [Hygrophoropsis aurantiaca]
MLGIHINAVYPSFMFAIPKMPPPLYSQTYEPSVKEQVIEAVDNLIQHLPARLLDTKTCRLHSRVELKVAFIQSQQFHSLVITLLPQPASQRYGIILPAFSQFFEYAMLSHRWQEGEPLYNDVEPLPLSDESRKPSRIRRGMAKLHNFLATANKMGFRWAWSDTCCIDRKNAVEHQESISSMYKWYRNSTVTIVYLADVCNSSESQLLRSEWFRRIWTLQEMLAPRALGLFNKDWTPFRKCNPSDRNDKLNDRMLELLESASGVDIDSLCDFTPGTSHARERLTWASTRKASRNEDLGYALMNLFNVRLIVHYGEGAAAFGRLIFSLLMSTKDFSLLDWVDTGHSLRSPINSALPALPSYFYVPGRQPPFKPYAYGPTRNTLPQPLELTIPCFTYKIVTADATYKTKGSQGGIKSCNVSALGLKPLHISTTENPSRWQRDVAGRSSQCILARPWHLDDVSVPEDSFHAMMLVQNHDGSYRRVSTTAPIRATVCKPRICSLTRLLGWHPRPQIQSLNIV